MEAVPRLLMIKFDHKHFVDLSVYTKPLRKYIRDHYNEDPSNYNDELMTLEQLRSSVVFGRLDLSYLGQLRKYFCQMKFLLSRFPINLSDSSLSVTFGWKDVYSMTSYEGSDFCHEQAAVLYNIGVYHIAAGAGENRSTPEGMRNACTHFQCAAWAFQYLNDTFPQSADSDLSPNLMNYMNTIALAQAQECILEKSLTDNRKPSIIAKVAMKVVEYHQTAIRLLDANISSFQSILGSKSKLLKSWRKYSELKQTYYHSVTRLYQALQAEEQQQMGERLAYLKDANDKLAAASKLVKGMDGEEAIKECFAFCSDVMGGKLSAAQKENEFVFHEKVPEISSLPEVKGASLVKGIQFPFNDPETSGPDIFRNLIPMEAHQASSMYSEEKATLLRNITSQIQDKNEELDSFMASMHLEDLLLEEDADTLPETLVAACADLNNRDALTELSASLSTVTEISTQVMDALNEESILLQEEEQQAEEFRIIMGKKKAPNTVLGDLKREAERLKTALTSARESDSALHKLSEQIKPSIVALALPLNELMATLPSVAEAAKKAGGELGSEHKAQLQRLMKKVDEMTMQRWQLEKQLREDLMNDDITGQLVTTEGDTTELFREQLKKHEKLVKVIEQNMLAQTNILQALSEANAGYAATRRAAQQSSVVRKQAVQGLVTAYDSFKAISEQCKEAHSFYGKLQDQTKKLLLRTKGVVSVQEDERQCILKAQAKKLSSAGVRTTESDTSYPRSVHGPLAPPLEEPTSTAGGSGLKLKDFLQAGGGFKSLSSGSGRELSPAGSAFSNYSMSAGAPIYSNQYSSTGGSIPGLASSAQAATVSPYGACVAQVGGQAGSAVYAQPMFGSFSSTSTQAPATTTVGASSQMGATAYSSYREYPGVNAPYSQLNAPHDSLSITRLPQTPSLTAQAQNTTCVASYIKPVCSIASSSGLTGVYSNAVSGGNNRPHVQQHPINAYSSYSAYYANQTPSTTTTTFADPYSAPLSSTGSTASVTKAALAAADSSTVVAGQSAEARATLLASSLPSGVAVAASGTTNHSLPPTGTVAGRWPSVPFPYPSSVSYMQSVGAPAVNNSFSSSAVTYPSGLPPKVAETYGPYSAISSHAAFTSATGYPPVTAHMGTAPVAGYPAVTSQLGAALTAGYQTVTSQFGTGSSTGTAVAIGYPSVTSNMSTASTTGYPSVTSHMSTVSTADFPHITSPLTAYPPVTSPSSEHHSMTSSISAYAPVTTHLDGTTVYSTVTSTVTVANYNSPDTQSSRVANAVNYMTSTSDKTIGATHSSFRNYGLYGASVAHYSAYGYMAQPQYSPAEYHSPHQSPHHQIYQPATAAASTVGSQIAPLSSASTAVSTSCAYRNGSNILQPNVSSAPVRNTTKSSPMASYTNVNKVSNLDLLSELDLSGPSSMWTPLTPISSASKSDPQSNGNCEVNGNHVDSSIGTANSVSEKTDLVDSEVRNSSENLDNNDEHSCARSKELDDSTNGSQPEQLCSAVAPVLPMPAVTQRPEPCARQSADPLDDSTTLETLVADTERLRKTVETLHRRSLNGYTNLETKWREIQESVELQSRTVSVGRCYPLKNRFADILPYDNTRVVLLNAKDDYINASHLHFKDPSSFPMVVSQVPTSQSLEDYWKMVWQLQTELVICLHTLPEIKNWNYWPAGRGPQHSLKFKDLSVSEHNSEEGGGGAWVQRLLHLTGSNGTVRALIHLQFLQWPPGGMPCSPYSLLSLCTEALSLQSQQRHKQRPILVTCVPGVGRSVLVSILLCFLGALRASGTLLELQTLCVEAATARRGGLQDKEFLDLLYTAALYAVEDVLMKRGILTNRTFEEGGPHGKCQHVRHPSADLLASSCDLNRLKSKLGLDEEKAHLGDTEREETASVEANKDGASSHESLLELVTAEEAAPSSNFSYLTLPPNLAASVDPAQLTLEPAPPGKGDKITKDSFSRRGSGGLTSRLADPNDPFSSLDPLWSLKKS